MNDKTNRRVYQPPQARDLSAYSAAGGDVGPMGSCSGGPYPYFACSVGTSYASSCGGGAAVDTSNCSAGGNHAMPACNVGASALTACLSGSHQNFIG